LQQGVAEGSFISRVRSLSETRKREGRAGWLWCAVETGSPIA